jgi:uncharacterized protein (TIGR01777 family)
MANPKNILITGASGLIGSRLTKKLHERGHTVTHLGRGGSKKNKINSYVWDIEKQYVDPDAFRDIDAVIHLAGAGVADKRWTKSRKQEILESRTRSSQLLFKALSENKNKVGLVISASAIGYYGFDRDDEIFTESTSPGKDFLADVVCRWEEEVDKLNALALRVVKIRIGIVLSKEGGVIKEVARPVKLFVGSPLGTGDQYVSWIHIEDLCEIFMKAVEDETLSGAYNATAITPVTNRDLTKAIADALHRPMFMPAVPAWILKLLLGELSDIVVRGSRVSSDKIRRAGFQFKFNDVQEAVTDLLK